MSADYHWRLVPLAAPKIFRRCSRCETKQAYVSSEKFRVNAQQKRLDVWLIYKCERCNATWNSTILSRVLPQEIPRELYDGFLNNDREVAERYAFDVELLKKNDVEVELNVDYRIEGIESIEGTEGIEGIERGEGEGLEGARGERVRIALDPGAVKHERLDHILKKALGVSNQALKRLAAEGALELGEAKLDKKLKGRIELVLALEAWRRERERTL